MVDGRHDLGQVVVLNELSQELQHLPECVMCEGLWGSVRGCEAYAHVRVVCVCRRVFNLDQLSYELQHLPECVVCSV